MRALCHLHVASLSYRSKLDILAAVYIRLDAYVLQLYPTSQVHCSFLLLPVPSFYFVLAKKMLKKTFRSLRLNDLEKGLSEEEATSKKHTRHIRRRRLHYLSIVSLCLFLSAICTVMEVYAVLNMEYCAGGKHQSHLFILILILRRQLMIYDRRSNAALLELLVYPSSRQQHRHYRRHAAALDRARQRPDTRVGRCARYTCSGLRGSGLDLKGDLEGVLEEHP